MLRIDTSLPTPPYEQLKDRIVQARASGEFPAEHRLPPVRHLAAELGLAPNTVARAFRELEAEGIISTRGRAGSFITGVHERRERGAEAAARNYLNETAALGLSAAEAISVVTKVSRDA